MSLKVSDEEMPEGDFEILSEMLARIEGGEIPNVEGLDGFLTAVVISPDLIMPSEYTSVITSGQTEDGDLVFESEQEASSFFGILMNHWNRINRVFQSGEIYMPILLEDEQGISRGNDWAKGFLRGTQLRHAEWTEAAGSEEHGGPFVYLWSLAYEDHPDPEIRSNKEPFAAEHREALISGMIAGVKLLYDYFQKHRSAPEPEFNVHVPYMRSGPKVGRNDPCPCGSGKKFKKCCGATTVH